MQIHGNHPAHGRERNTIGGLGRHRKALYNCQELWRSKILPSLQADRLHCHSFKDTGSRVEIPESEAKGSILLTVIAVAIKLAYFASLSPNSHRVSWRGQMIPTNAVGLLQKNSEYWEPESCIICSQDAWLLHQRQRWNFIILNRKHACPLLHRETLPLFLKFISKPALCSEGRHNIYISKLLAIWISLKRYFRTKDRHYLCLQDVQKYWEIHRKLSSNISSQSLEDPKKLQNNYYGFTSNWRSMTSARIRESKDKCTP